MSEDAPAPLPALTVSAVAARLGVAPATLRTWDRRYSLGPSSHRAGSHRRYTGADIARLMIMRRLTLEGVAPSEAARIALATAVDNQMSQSFLSDDGTYLPAVPVSANASGAVPKGQARPVDILGDGVTAGFTPSQLASRAYDKDIREALVSAATGFDEVGAIRLVQAVSDARGVADTWTQIVKGTVIELMGSSDLVAPGMDPLSVAKTAVMITLRRAARQKEAGPTSDQCIMVAAAPDEVSTLGAHVLSAALNQSDASSAVLLGRVEVPVVRDTIKNSNPAVIVMVSWTEPNSDMSTAVDYCLETAADVPVILTGPSWPTETPAGAHRVRTFIGALHEAQAYVS